MSIGTLLKLQLILITLIASLSISYGGDSPDNIGAGEKNSLILEDLKIGFNGYYRPGYWCPLKARFKTYQASFKGNVVFQIDNSTYTFPLEIPPDSVREVSGSVLIHSTAPQVSLAFPGGNNQPLVLNAADSLNEVPSDEFLIGIEYKLFYNFLKEFGRFSDATKHSRFFSFQTDDLPRNHLSYETVDLLVVSEETFKIPNLKETLTRWRDSEQGNILVYTGGDIALEKLEQLKPTHLINPCINPEAIQLFELPTHNQHSPLQAERVNQTILSALLICFLSSLIILTFWSGWPKWKKNRFPEKRHDLFFYVIFSAIILGTILLLTIYFRPSSLAGGESVRFIVTNPDSKIQREYSFLGFNSLRNETLDLSIETSPGTLRPVFSTLDAAVKNSFNLFFSKQQMTWKDYPVAPNRLTCFEKSTSSEQTGIRVSKTTEQGKNRYRLINESGHHLQDAYLVNQDLYFYLGDISGRDDTLLPDFSLKDNALSYEQWKRKSAPDRNPTERYRPRLFEFSRKRFDLARKTYVFGWTENTDHWPGLSAPDIMINYSPTLWIILLE